VKGRPREGERERDILKDERVRNREEKRRG
jgi:hypothetical protein